MVFLPFSFILLLFIPLFCHAADTFTGKGVGISDGDTIKVIREGRAVRVRLYGIDCPEKKQPFGTKAKWVTSDLAFRKEVEVRVLDTDRYGRLVGEVILPNVRRKREVSNESRNLSKVRFGISEGTIYLPVLLDYIT